MVSQKGKSVPILCPGPRHGFGPAVSSRKCVPMVFPTSRFHPGNVPICFAFETRVCPQGPLSLSLSSQICIPIWSYRQNKSLSGASLSFTQITCLKIILDIHPIKFDMCSSCINSTHALHKFIRVSFPCVGRHITRTVSIDPSETTCVLSGICS